MNKKKAVTKLISICAWCGEKRHGEYDDYDFITHGICQECFVNVLKDLDEAAA